MKNFGELYDAIEEMFSLEKGEFIKNPERKIQLIPDAQIGRKALKHIIERRKEERSFFEDINLMLIRAIKCLKNPDFILNNKKSMYKSSFVSGKLFPKDERGIIVVYELKGKIREVITVFYRSEKRFNKTKGR
jgi:hypothetical protein